MLETKIQVTELTEPRTQNLEKVRERKGCPWKEVIQDSVPPLDFTGSGYLFGVCWRHFPSRLQGGTRP